ncbi:MAG: DUF5946 family protein [Candidatus Promineifilaceae bacterium]
MFGELLAKVYEEYAFPDGLRLATDAYAVQHPGTPSRKSIQSVAVHLISLHHQLERGSSAGNATFAMGRVAAHSERFKWLEPPSSMGAVTVVDVYAAQDATEHQRLVQAWAEATWVAWSAHHAVIRHWANSL